MCCAKNKEPLINYNNSEKVDISEGRGTPTKKNDDMGYCHVKTEELHL